MVSRIALAISLLLLLPTTAFARPASNEGVLARAYPAPPVLARAAAMLDARTGAVLDAVNPTLRLPMASTTKIMTAILALKLGKLTDVITVPKSAFNYEWDATVMGLKAGERVTLKDLLYGLLLPSGADAANTIAIHYAGSESKFVALMNQEAAALGLNNTHYSDDTGLTSVHHYTTAYDLARLARYATGIPDLMTVVNTKYYTWNRHLLTNVNHVLFWYPGVDGIKPGFTNEAGICQTLDAWRHGRHVVISILNTPNLVTDARNLLNYGLGDYTWIQSALPGDSPNVVQAASDKSGPYVYFPVTGHTIRGAFRKAFDAAGLQQLGFPRTEPLREGSLWVQYFQNGALAEDMHGHVYRLPLGTLTSAVPTPSTRKTSHVLAAQSSTTRTPTPTPKPKPENTVTPHPTPTRVTPTVAPTVTPIPRPTIASVFRAFQRKHSNLLGTPVASLFSRPGYEIQVFSYSALAYDTHARAVVQLPLGDRILSARGWLSGHPGNGYPAGYASVSALKAIGWFPHGVPYVAPAR